jgi:glycosyltransferase involved in cell wall biosynthesis
MRTYWAAYRLAEQGHEVHVVTNAKEASPPFRMHMRPVDWARCEARFIDGSLTVHWSDPVDASQSYIPMASPFVSKLTSIVAMLHEQHPFDVIYSHYMEPYGVAGYLASKITGAPHVVRMAGSDAGRLWSHPQFETLYDHILRSAAVVISGGSVGQRAIERGVNPGRIVLGGGYALPEALFTPGGPVIDPESLKGELASTNEDNSFWGGLTGDGNYFGVYGKLGETKGSFALLAAIHQLKLAGVYIGLVAMAHGKPEVERRFRQTAQELGITDRVLQIPFLPHWRVPEFLRSCLAVCCLEQDFPIRAHTPMVAREVLLCGRCLVTSAELHHKLPDYDQLPSGYGCVAVENVNDIDELAQHLADIANDPDPAVAVGARGREFACQLERQSDFPRGLEKILAAAAARRRIAATPLRSKRPSVAPDEPFQLTRLCADALRKAVARIGLPQKGPIDLTKARAIHAATKEAAAKGTTNLRALVQAIEVEIAVAEAQQAVEHQLNGQQGKAFVRLDIRRWAVGLNDFAELRPMRDPRLRVIEFEFDAAQYLGARKVENFPTTATMQPSYMAVFAPDDDRRREPLLLGNATARILQLCEGSLTCLQVANRSKSEFRSSIDQCLGWIEDLFRGGLIGLCDRDHIRMKAFNQHAEL